MQLRRAGLLTPAIALNTPPPLALAELLLNVVLVTVGLLLPALLIAPPPAAEFPLKMQFAITGLLEFPLTSPPPPTDKATFPKNAQFMIVGLLLTSLYRPPPLTAAEIS
jgi:hypothetical protein